MRSLVTLLYRIDRIAHSKSVHHVPCVIQAEPETLSKVSGIIAQQLAINLAEVLPESKFTELGADSLDTVSRHTSFCVVPGLFILSEVLIQTYR